MIAKEINDIFEESEMPAEQFGETSRNPPPPKQHVYPIEPRHRRRYNEVDLNGEQFLVPKSCKGCYGTGIYCWIPEDKNKGTSRMAVKCSCLIRPEENKSNAKEV